MTCTMTRNRKSSLTIDSLREVIRQIANLYYHSTPYVGEPGQAYIVSKGYSMVDKPVVILHPQDEKKFLRLCAEHNVVAAPLRKDG
jgi:hypothetical protein